MKAVKSLALLLLFALSLVGCGLAGGGLPSPDSGLLGMNADGTPNGFLWGVSTAAYQYEGGNTASQWTTFEQAGHTQDVCGLSCDGWHLYGQDMDLARGMGCNAWRMSIDWARVEPVEGQIDYAALAHYHQIIDKAVADGLTPVITLMHFSYPKWLDAQGGWQGPNAVPAFSHFVTLVAQQFGSQVKTYLTINEPTTFVLGGYLSGSLAPGIHNPITAYQVMNHLVEAHRAAYHILHSLVPGVRVSANEYVADYMLPGNHLPWLVNAAEDWFLSQVAGPSKWNGPGGTTLDFLALDYYCRINVNLPFKFPQDWEWPVDPAGFTRTLERYYAQYHLPILIAENGMATDNGAPRPDGWTRASYLVAHVKALQDAQNAGVQTLGYFVWSITDNYEWGSFTPRFGLYRVECKKGDLTRVPTRAVDAYRQVIAAQGVTRAIYQAYPPPPGGNSLWGPLSGASQSLP